MRQDLIACMVAACLCQAFPAMGQADDRGAVLSEESRPLYRDFREVRTSRQNAPGHFESIGHFVSVYYKDEKLCDCRPREVAIAPDAGMAVYVDSSTEKLMLFVASSRSRKELAQQFIGYPTEAKWGPARVEITLERYKDGVPSYTKLAVPL